MNGEDEEEEGVGLSDLTTELFAPDNDKDDDDDVDVDDDKDEGCNVTEDEEVEVKDEDDDKFPALAWSFTCKCCRKLSVAPLLPVEFEP